MLTARILLGQGWRIAQLLLAPLVLAALLSIGTATVATAANTNCVVTANVADCPDVPSDGISYVDHPTVNTVNTLNGTAGSTTVNSGTIGINLKKTGVDSTYTGTEVAYEVITYDIDAGSGTDNRKVLAKGGIPVLVSGDYIFSQNAENTEFKIGTGTTVYNNATLATYLQGAGIGGVAAVSGSLTVNNSVGGVGTSFSTTNADGIHVESLGGRGGNGGCTTILIASWCDNGGSGGDAGSVAVNNDGTIVVNGTGYGVSATSTGGAGGNGGGMFGLFGSSAGTGGTGGNGAKVTVNLGSNSNITTWGNGGHGVYAVSNGGDGGGGGSASGAVALGSKGGQGGAAGEVQVDNAGTITTHGAKAYGIFAQSMGAGAGSGSSAGGIVAIGGSGGKASVGNKVTVSNTGTIETWGADSFGILAQSIGGGGGDGGSSGGLFAVGGRGDAGGPSDIVKVYNTGTIITHQAGAAGILAQSVGGGGGNGGNAYSGGVTISVAVGGNGGLGGAGGKVAINDLALGQTVADLAAGSIATSGDRAHGIQAQSVGGGGGNGGLAVAVAVDPLFAASVAMGGKGDNGGNGDTVVVNEKGKITTGGNQSHGIFAQSVGGGGGNGGGSVAASASGGYSLGVSLGGGGGGGGSASTVTVNALGSIDTTGNLSHGILAQSVGGGGGNGGFSVAVTGGAMSGSVSLGGDGSTAGNGSTVTVNTAGIDATNMTIHTRGDGSHGIFAQSVGGGGGSGGLAAAVALGGGSVSVGLGGSGAGGGKGDTVTVTNRNTILTDKANSYGILAQSVGGGGGNGGFTFTGSAGVMAAAVAVGGGGGAGGNGGDVTVDNFGDITTKGDLSYGMLVQSVGGGGGNGGSAVAATVTISIKDIPAIGASVAIGGAGGTASIGGLVTLNNDGSVTTGTATLVAGKIVRTGNGAHALFAQSVGGGGGSGGFAGAVAIAIDPTGSGAAAFAVAVGGRGGTGGNAGAVLLGNTGEALKTYGDGADAIHAQSVGGGGGDGGFGLAIATAVGAAPESKSLALSVAIGGKGGAAGNGNTVTVTNSGAITTYGKFSNGIYAQSTGGGGGSGGFAAAFSGSFSTAPDSNSAAVGVSVGGSGAGGGNGMKVTVSSSGAITTSGESSNAIFAQSVGGGGGNGGFAASGTIAIATKPDSNAFQAAVAVGGKGGIGGTGGMVEIDNSGAIITYGKESLGILAQSIGGGGGNGGMSVVGQIDKGTGNTGKIGVSVGGGGGNGNFAGVVDVDNLAGGSINTYGFGSHAIKAQSIGGGGGNGGMAIYGGLGFSGEDTSVTIGVAVGGGGGNGGYGNTVDVTNNGAIDVQGDSATGIFAQSVGGGGGDGGGSFTGMLGVSNSNPENKDAMTVQVAVAIGGGGGDGNLGGAVIVNNTGSIETGSATLVGGEIVRTGGAGYGIFAQSVGGGGGIGGRANAMNLLIGTKCSLPLVCDGTKSSGNNISLTATVGGNGGTASHGGDVTVDNTGVITTWGHDADGIFAQSIGGSGGVGGNGILGTGDVSPVPVELLFLPVGASKIYKTLSVAVGGNAGSSGNGGIVDVDNSKNITTYGDNSNGILAQSIGGGGGVGGRGVIGATGTIGVGGKGGSAGDGGAVYVSNLGTAKIETFGAAASGVFAESVGGGGGVAGNVNRMLAGGVDVPLVGHLGVNVGIGLGLGQSAGGGGDGGLVEVDVAGQIITHGDSAAGIFAHSVGGGGGVLGELGNDLPVLNLLSWHIGSNGGAGNAGAVTVDLNGTVKTAGNSATGIFAQSTGGTGTAGKVTVSVTGTVQTAAILTAQDISGGLQTRGLGSVGIMAQSAGWGGNGDVEITLDSAAGIVSGGRSAVMRLDNPATALVNEYAEYVGVGVWIIDGKNNTVTNYGTITTANGVDGGMAIYATGSDSLNAEVAKRQLGGNEAISNFGTITGSVDLGIGTNSFVNEELGTFNSGHFAKFGDGNVLTNFGVMAAGGTNKVMTTAVNGNMVQDIKGTYAVDVDLAKSHLPPDPALEGEADLIDVDGTLEMLGEVDLTLLNMGNALPGDHQVTIAKSAVALTGTPTLTAPASVVATYALSQTEKELLLSYGIDFDVEGLNPNQSAIGEYINAFQLAGGSDVLEPVVASLFQIPDLETYQETLDQLSPEPYLINETLAMLAGLQFENSLMSCKVQESIDAEGQCVWTAVNQRKTERSETDTNLGFAQTSYGLSAGAQARIDEHFVAGIGGSWEDIGTDSNGNVSSTGNRFQAGAVFKGVWGNTVLAGAITGGWSSQNVSRFVDMPLGPSYVLEGTQDIGFASAHVRLSHSIEQDNWYVRPMVDVGVTQVSIADFAETGGPVALEIDGHDETYVTVAPSIELGGEMDLGEDAILRSFIRVGALDVVLGTAPEISAGFAGAPDGVEPFTITGDLDEALFDVTLGFDVIANNGATFRLTGDAKVGETVKSYGGAMKISAPF
ncbi:MAG: autotransporter outer membrane beta-barrel domain-containing protein [Hyphomicrobiales bacterium]|nr:MAG: autotransporter outer membrane beta-barrel domain-containing protein [Hyphomicrobiales bacterium]